MITEEKTTFVGIKAPISLRHRLEVCAAIQERTMSGIVRLALQNYLKTGIDLKTKRALNRKIKELLEKKAQTETSKSDGGEN